MKKLTAIIMSLILVFSSATVFAVTDTETDFSKYIDYDADYTKDDINRLGRLMNVGDKYTVESLEKLSYAYNNAMEVVDNPDATQEEINTAYFRYYEAILSLEICKLDEALIRLCYNYCVYLSENYIDYFTEESKSLIGDSEFSSQMAILYTNTQEGIDETAQKTIATLKTLELTEENPDIVLWTELEQIDELMQEYISKNIFEGVDYRYNRIPIFKDFNGYRMVLYYNLVVGPMFNVQRYGDYIIEMNGFYHPSDLCYVLVNPTTGDIISLSQGLINGIVDPDKLFDAYLDSPFDFYMHIIGDANCDNQLSITDATYIQKICAGLEDDSNTYQASNFNDFNNDRKVNIIDATEIQKALIS